LKEIERKEEYRKSGHTGLKLRGDGKDNVSTSVLAEREEKK
jgi:hypothetical protein